MIVDTVIELTDAERGFLLLEDDDGELEVKVARNIDQRTLETAEFELSRSIARQAAAGGEPIVTIDAAGDARFREALSVSDLHLRSVLAVPLAIKGRVVGTIYVDHRLRKGAFDEDDVRLVLDFAEQAAIALENARLLAELRRRERQVEALNRRLEAELAARREELSGIKQELRDNREALAVRYDYRNIIGRTPRMLELFRLLDRITDTTLPVVIQGESGTGKELVARAIHSNGPRARRPFVGVNCAAIPETLLESSCSATCAAPSPAPSATRAACSRSPTAARCSSTRSARCRPACRPSCCACCRRASSGASAASARARSTCASSPPPTAISRAWSRRASSARDLYYRLNVVQIALPPLRERRDDIPLLVEHFLAKQRPRPDGRAPKPLDPAALARLVAYRWPGNVRELENEITRADALVGRPHRRRRSVAAGRRGRRCGRGGRRRSRQPAAQAARRAPGAVAAARGAGPRRATTRPRRPSCSGLSRFGLQKKLKRYNFSV